MGIRLAALVRELFGDPKNDENPNPVAAEFNAQVHQWSLDNEVQLCEEYREEAHRLTGQVPTDDECQKFLAWAVEKMLTIIGEFNVSDSSHRFLKEKMSKVGPEKAAEDFIKGYAAPIKLYSLWEQNLPLFCNEFEHSPSSPKFASTRIRVIARKLLASKNPSRSAVAADLKKLLAVLTK